MNPESLSSFTLYPKISGKHPDLNDAIDIHALDNAGRVKDPIPFTGTVKLHGTHADVLIFPDGKIGTQSRNRVICLDSDNLGFAAFAASRAATIKDLAEQIRERYRVRNLAQEPTGTVLLAGEWIGHDVQKGVAICQLSRRFVICGIHVAGVWQPMEHFADIEDEEGAIFNIARRGFFRLDWSFSGAGEGFMAAAKGHTLEVERLCPFGRAFGVEGTGEGIVWVPAADSGLPNNSNFWFKTKAEHFHAKIHDRVLAENATRQIDQQQRARVFACSVCTESRLEQGWQYLAEMGVTQDGRGTGTFLSWVVNDIDAEEWREIEALKLRKSWKREARKLAKEWYAARLKEGVRGGTRSWWRRDGTNRKPNADVEASYAPLIAFLNTSNVNLGAPYGVAQHLLPDLAPFIARWALRANPDNAAPMENWDAAAIQGMLHRVKKGATEGSDQWRPSIPPTLTVPAPPKAPTVSVGYLNRDTPSDNVGKGDDREGG